VATLKIREPAGSDTWVELSQTGERGSNGGAVPTGGDPTQVIVKTGPADLEVGWVTRPRVALNTMVADITSHATANNYVDVIVGDVDIDPTRFYHIFAGLRCIQDPGGICTAEAQVFVGTVQLAGNDLWTTQDTNGYWGAWNQNWLSPGTHFTAVPATLTVTLQIRLSNATSKKFYSPRLQVIEY